MKTLLATALVLSTLPCCLANAAPAADPLTQAIRCDRCEQWNQPVAPTHLYGNTWYVGVHGMSSVLLAGSQGLILIDGDLPQSAPLIEANIRALGFKVSEVKLILNSHTHFDHAGGIAALQRDSGAQVAASPSSAQALRQGHPVANDPQTSYANASFPPVASTIRVLADAETLHLGNLAVTAHFTPGHTPGSTTWTWQSCEGERCLSMVYADSLNAVSAPGFHYAGNPQQPDLPQRFHASIDQVAALPCDILITVHPEQAGLWDALQARQRGLQPDPLIAPDACRAYADDARKLLDERLAKDLAEESAEKKQ